MEVSGQLHAPAALPLGRAPGTHWIRGWVGPRTVLNAVVKRKIPSPRRESNPRTLIVQPVAQRYTDWAITAPKNYVFLMLYLGYVNLYLNYNTLFNSWAACWIRDQRAIVWNHGRVISLIMFYCLQSQTQFLLLLLLLLYSFGELIT
jgi:hypothetical protein